LLGLAAVTPAQATILLAGTSLLPTQPFSVIAATQGTLLASTTVSGSALTFATTVKAAVYRNTLGTLDFYYQVLRTGPGTIPGSRGNQQITSFTASDFTSFAVDAYASGPDPDGAGFFTVINNPPSSTTTFGRSPDDAVVQIAFGVNGLKGTENSATYVLRTNARSYTTGTFGVIDGSTFSGLAYAPLAVPEPEVWGLMMVGFGAVGFAARRRKTAVAN
jgi:hypothetical protein